MNKLGIRFKSVRTKLLAAFALAAVLLAGVGIYGTIELGHARTTVKDAREQQFVPMTHLSWFKDSANETIIDVLAMISPTSTQAQAKSFREGVTTSGTKLITEL